MRIRSSLYLIAAVALVASLLAFHARIAAGKQFWLDEANAEAGSSTASYASILLDGAPSQCSPPPLYYLLQKAIVPAIGFDAPVLVSYRALSLASAALTAGALLFGLEPLGAFAALSAFAALIAPEIFHPFAAEDRPYMLWVSCLSLFLLLLARAQARGFVGTRSWWVLLACALALSLVSGAGGVQVVGAAAVALLLLPRSASRGARLGVSAMGAIGLVTLVFYRSPCDAFPGQYNLLETRNLGLVHDVLRIFLSKGSVPLFLTSVLVVIGTYAAFRSLYAAWRSRAPDPATSLAGHVAAQLALAIPVAVMVALKGYFFVPRVFIFLIPLRAMLAAFGAILIVKSLRSPRAPAIASVLALVLATYTLGRTIGVETRAYPRVTTAPFCSGLPASLEIHKPSALTDTEAAQSLALLQSAIANCPREVGRPARAIAILSAPGAPPSITQRASETQLNHFGQPVILHP